MNLTQSEIKYIRSLQQKKNRDAEGKFLLEGWRPLQDALQSDYHIELIAVLPDASLNSEHQQLLAVAKKLEIPVKELKNLQLNQISDEVHSQGVVALVHQQKRIFDLALYPSSRFIVACDHVSDPGNLGTILRTCDWFAVDAVTLSSGCVSLYNEKVVRSTAGSLFHLNIHENMDLSTLFSNMRQRGWKVAATALNGISLKDSVLPDKTILLLGNEARGVDSKLLQQADEVVSIPRFGKAESLNVGIACGIFLAHWRNQPSTIT